MSKLLVVFGASGQQGNSVATYVANDPVLSKEYKVRAITRDPSKLGIQDLKIKGVEIVKGDFNDEGSIKGAMEGAHTVFAVTVSIYESEQGKQKEVKQGKVLVDRAIEAGAQYFIWSSQYSPAKISNGNLKQVSIFEAKAEVEEYIRNLQIKSAFYSPGSFMQNFQDELAPRPVGDSNYAIFNVFNPSTQLPLIDIAADTGKFVGAILADPEKYEGKVFTAATKLYTLEETVKIISQKTGKNVSYIQMPEDKFKGFLPPSFADELLMMFIFFRDYGYYGSETKERVEWTTQQARGKLTSLEEYLSKNSLNIE